MSKEYIVLNLRSHRDNLERAAQELTLALTDLERGKIDIQEAFARWNGTCDFVTLSVRKSKAYLIRMSGMSGRINQKRDESKKKHSA